MTRLVWVDRELCGLPFWTVTIVGTILCVPSSLVRGFVGLAGACGFPMNGAAEANMEYVVVPMASNGVRRQGRV
ncbi:hypothetical protein BV898_05418 [Hypsibius exemplaris]|uniref:Uncharacterized protein n=1 Tax=Hypsibius exemplaris TaxID=2072580 RepID=A0A1W0WZK7_HYPEX|nr:hypothetical protein BV898_05418 [Hypsibius exemplaris]